MPTPPKGKLCGIGSSYLLCFNIPDDFDQDGYLKPGVKGTRVPSTYQDLYKGWYMDAATKESLQAYALKIKARHQQLEKSCN